jgi:hypothetical protein
MAEWEYSSLTWEIRQEQIAPERWLCCFRRPEERIGNTPHHWIYVFDRKFDDVGAALSKRTQIDFVVLEEHDPLMMECIAIEMRKKYSDTP